jgi:hypothetical protein
VKLLVVAVACLALLVACGGGSPPIPNFEPTVDEKVTQGNTEKLTPTLETANATEIQKTTSTPMPAETPISGAIPITEATPATEPTAQVNPQDAEKCENASGEMVQICMNQAIAMIAENPKLCQAATGMMAFMCQNKAPESETTTHADSGSGRSSEIANPCDKVAKAFRDKCEESIRNDPKSVFYVSGSKSNVAKNFDPDDIPQIAKFNFTELEMFSRMTKLRSAVGHDYSFDTTEFDPDGLSCRSMKHYFVPVGVPRDNMLYNSTPHTFEWMSIKFFAPTDGVITNLVRTTNAYGPEAQFAITSNDHPGYFFNYYHVKLLPDLDTGSAVTAGQQIGTLGSEDAWGEIAVQVQIARGKNHLLSFLQVATDEVLEEYRARGFDTVSDVIITKEQRDADPIGCDVNSEARWFQGSGRGETVLVEAFTIWAFESTDNWFFFN